MRPRSRAFGRKGPHLVVFRQMFGRLRPYLGDFGLHWPEFGRRFAISTEFAPTLAKFGPLRLADSDHILAMTGKLGPDSSNAWRCLPNLDQIRPFVCQLWAISADVGPLAADFVPDSSNSGRIWSDLGQCPAEFGQFRAESVKSVLDSSNVWRSRPDLDQLWRKFGRTWAMSTEFGPMSSLARVRAHLGDVCRCSMRKLSSTLQVLRGPKCQSSRHQLRCNALGGKDSRERLFWRRFSSDP